jgi:hypothetical protein
MWYEDDYNCYGTVAFDLGYCSILDAPITEYQTTDKAKLSYDSWLDYSLSWVSPLSSGIIIGGFIYCSPAISTLQIAGLLLTGIVSETVKENTNYNNFAEFIEESRWYVIGLTISANAKLNLLPRFTSHKEDVITKPIAAILSASFTHSYANILHHLSDYFHLNNLNNIGNNGLKNNILEDMIKLSGKAIIEESLKDYFKFDHIKNNINYYSPSSIAAGLITITHPFYYGLFRSLAGLSVNYLTESPNSDNLESQWQYLYHNKAWRHFEYPIEFMTKDLLNSIKNDHPYLYIAIPAIGETIFKKTVLS